MGRIQRNRSFSGRGGGRGNGRNYNNRNKSSNSNNYEVKFAPHVQGKPQQVTYATVKDSIIQYIQKTYTKNGQDVARSLEDMQLVDLSGKKPTRQISLQTDVNAREVNQKGLGIEYQEAYSRYLDRVEALEQGMLKAYSLIYSNYCTKTMQTRIEEHPEFATKIRNDPIALLAAIKESMHTPVRSQYPLVSMTDALTRVVNIRQYEDEPLLDFVKRFKQERDVLKSHVGTRILDGFVMQSEEYKNASQTKKDAILNAEFEKWMALLVIRGSDQTKYGSLSKHFISQFSMGNDQYPKSIADATDILGSHKFDPKYTENKNRNQERQQTERAEQEERPPATSFAQTNYIC